MASFDAAAQDYDPILVPLDVGVIQGANGSEFRTDIEAVNNSKNPVVAFPLFFECGPHCDFGRLTTPLQPGFPIRINVVRSAPSVGAIIWVERGASHSLSVNGRLISSIGGSPTDPVHIVQFPIVTLDQFRSEQTFVGIPVFGNEGRVRLRIYQISAPVAPVTVFVFGGVSQDPVTVIPQGSGESACPLFGSTCQNPLLISPYYAELSVQVNYPPTGFPSLPVIRVVSAEPQARLWSMVSVTDNTTAETTIYAPAP